MPAARGRSCSSRANHYVGAAPVPLDAVQALHGRVQGEGAAHRDARARARRPSRTWCISDRVMDQLGPGHQRRPLDVRLRPSRQRQDRHLAGDSEAARRRPARSRTRSRSKAQIIRLFDPVDHEELSSSEHGPTGLDRGARRRPALGALPAADGDGRRRADARGARAELQPERRLLQGAGAGARQRRRAGHRRLRPPACRAARPAEPLDRAARKPRRLPHAATPARSSSCRS